MAQNLYAESGADLKTDILKYPHHGYEPLRPGFLAMTSPELAICTCGQRSADGLTQLKRQGISYVRTAPQALRLTTDGRVWLVEAFE